jgi:hypothetical protein
VKRFLNSCSDNLKPVLSPAEGSKACPEQRRRIQNQKLVGLVTFIIAFVICGVAVEAQQHELRAELYGVILARR